MRDVDVVVLSRFPEIFEGFRAAVEPEALKLNKIVVWDDEERFPGDRKNALGWHNLRSPFIFKMAHNANIGLRASRRDVLYCGDDTRIIEPDTIKRLQELAYANQIGILSPSINGLCAYEKLSEDDCEWNPLSFVGFVFVYIKREVIEKIGYLEEDYVGYGMEDISYCHRARKAGFRIGMARDIHVQHGVDGHKYGSTFIRTTGEEEMGKQDRANLRRFAEKWGLDPDDTRGIFQAIRDLSATERR